MVCRARSNLSPLLLIRLPAHRDAIRYAGPTSSYATGKHLLPEAKQLLVDFYKPYNARLAKLLEDKSLEAWVHGGTT